MPDSVEAMYYTSELSSAKVQAVQLTHQSWLRRYPQLDAAANPLLVLDRSNWEHACSDQTRPMAACQIFELLRSPLSVVHACALASAPFRTHAVN